MRLAFCRSTGAIRRSFLTYLPTTDRRIIPGVSGDIYGLTFGAHDEPAASGVPSVRGVNPGAYLEKRSIDWSD
jgi:hypothetical protein